MSTVTFAFHQLGWSDFQSLCRTVTREILGQTVTAYLDGNDGGRDGAFSGTWTPTGNEELHGEFVIQAKHTTKPASTLGPADFADELDKAERLAAAGRCDVYVLMTNARITAKTEQLLHAELGRRGITQTLILGATWINETISENPRLRMLVPRLYGLGDLTQILDARAYQQARAVLDSMRTNLAKLVRTTTHQKAADALDNFGFVLLTGAPATGKTTVAGQLALGAADAFDTQVIVLDDAAQFPDRWNPDEKQLFWLDDAFGATQFDWYLASSWQRRTPSVLAAIDGGCKFVLTTRDYILRAAWPHLKPGSFPLLEGTRVVVDVTDLTRNERRQILYNHLKHGRQPEDRVRAFVPHLDYVADLPGFTPELARRLADPAFTTNLGCPSAANLRSFFDQPRQFLADTLAGLDQDSLAALGLIFLSRNWLASPIALSDTHLEFLRRAGGSLAGVTRSLAQMEGSLVANIGRDGHQGWVFAHPTMMDAYADRLRGPEFVHFLVEAFGIEALLAQTTCGDTGLHNAIVLLEPLWPSVMDRLDEPLGEGDERWRQHDRRRSYLASRCVPEFQTAYLERHPDLIESLAKPGLMLEFDADNDLVASLYANGVLPDATRGAFVDHLIEYCIDGSDGAVLWASHLRAMLTLGEEQMLRERLLAEVVPHPRSILNRFVEGAYAEEDPEQFTAPIEEFADALEAEFPHDPTVEAAAHELRDARWEWIYDNPPHERPLVSEDRYRAPEPEYRHDLSERSIFDDLVVDQALSYVSGKHPD